MPSCIFHLPLKLDFAWASASHIRPLKMLQAFQSIGYDVSVVMGSAEERKAQGDAIKQRILNGERFDFVYSESSTMPTQLTEPNHFPISRSIDFGFLDFCHEHGIRIGLFYRDVYWKFPEYRTIGFLKSSVAIAYYKRDLREYARLLDVLYMPTAEAFEIVQNETSSIPHMPLPPGSDVRADVMDKRIAKTGDYAARAHNQDNVPLRLLYIGGIGSHYGFDGLIEALKAVEEVEITFCVREDDFSAYSRSFELRDMPNVSIVHASGEALEPLYEQADVAVMLFDTNPYRKAAMPFKTFEYLAHGLPLLSTSGNAVANFVAQNNVGWVTDLNAQELSGFLRELAHNWRGIAEKSLTCLEVALSNTWLERARSVAELLTRK